MSDIFRVVEVEIVFKWALRPPKMDEREVKRAERRNGIVKGQGDSRPNRE